MRKFTFVRRWALLVVFVVLLIYLGVRNEIGPAAGLSGRVCSSDVINTGRFEQDDPCVVSLIRRDFLRPPVDGPLNLDRPEVVDPSEGQVPELLNLLNNQTGGFFVECGATDGEYMSNTLFLERFLNWTGILIEANPTYFERLSKKNRRSWSIPACLSLEPHPTQVWFKSDEVLGKIETDRDPATDRMTRTQCFPLYSILAAAGRTTVDLFSLDVEGHELKVLQTIPWDKVDIKVLLVEWKSIRLDGVELDSSAPLDAFMERNGYRAVHNFHYLGHVYPQQFLDAFRPDEDAVYVKVYND